MPVGTRRSDLEIIRDILSVDLARTTELRYSVNLSYPQLQKYLGFLEQSQLIQVKKQGSRSSRFAVTDKGRGVLEQLNQLFLILGLESPEESEVWT
ncbi:MAG: winged helix-turn-helix domain-containing protein [Dehalococcoidia bacterium]